MRKWLFGFLSGAITMWIVCAALGWKVLRDALQQEREDSAWDIALNDAEVVEGKRPATDMAS